MNLEERPKRPTGHLIHNRVAARQRHTLPTLSPEERKARKIKFPNTIFADEGDSGMTKVEKQGEDIMGGPQNTEGIASEDLSDDALADRFVGELHEEGVFMENINEENSGLGDAIEKALSKVGVTSEKIEKIFGIGGCGCGARKQFLNKLFPFFGKKKVDIPEEEPPE